ncbi:NDP-hexose 2,3-dehydratase family protein [Streptomyces tubbatahanensis]|uniref:NDP-hexose 2,3-dehydratase family protein n=1 Tax=Streptomyces tubbatahanensis TaxID=2923272 RepID=A0ABY3Y1U9_9ACTN|nr:NDP-hexose 2,3-dehydratase family protein [Streptomyces tubbatahanensis]UNT00813.1 NDP-hexose 2,3-dehydratase family protein [Streptomyces tubbatahanensis]
MTTGTPGAAARRAPAPPDPSPRLTESAAAGRGPEPVKETLRWLAARRAAHTFEVERVPFAQLHGWSFRADTGDLGHASGRFFTVQGHRVHSDYGPIPRWEQPIINQPEVGVLGFLVKEIDGVVQCLMQAKMEPGNANVVQLSPTVQATRSNYSRVHGGAAVRYLEYFTDPGRSTVLVDVLQSEQGSWFLGKRNRNIVVEVQGDVEVHEDYRWMPVGTVLELLHSDNAVNMDARTVLSCMPLARPTTPPGGGEATHPRAALRRSVTDFEYALHPMRELLHWFTDRTARHDLRTERVPLAGIEGWRRTPEAISHAQGRYFSVIGARVRAGSREVREWTQPLLAPHGLGLAALVVKRVHGVAHLLLHARPEAGHLHGVELAPTVQCTPDNYRGLPAGDRPRFLEHIEAVPADRVRFDAVQSEEGGRFHRAECRYMIVEAGDEVPLKVPEGYRWLAAHQVTRLLEHSHYLNVQARTLVACLHSLW